jgi:hypothetical protein
MAFRVRGGSDVETRGYNRDQTNIKELKTAVHIYNSRCHRKILSSEHLACSFDYSGAI